MGTARDISINHNEHERRDPITGAILTTKHENERSIHEGLVTQQIQVGPGSIVPLDTLLANEVLVITFIHAEPIEGSPGRLVINEHGDGLGAGTTIFSTGDHTAIGATLPPFRRPLGRGTALILGEGP